jgi:hypothetical protein
MLKIKTSIVSAIFSLFLLIGFGTWAYQQIEGWTFGQSFYFSVATLTTVGYGDIHPTTDASRIFTAIYILIGVGVVIAALTSIGSRYLYSQEKELSNNITRRIKRQQKKKSRRKRIWHRK